MKLTNSLNVKQLIETEWFDQFDSMQQKHIEEGYHMGQVTELVNGLLSGVDVTLYEDLSLNSLAMSTIRKNLERGIDVSQYVHQRFYIKQVDEINK